MPRLFAVSYDETYVRRTAHRSLKKIVKIAAVQGLVFGMFVLLFNRIFNSKDDTITEALQRSAVMALVFAVVFTVMSLVERRNARKKLENMNVEKAK